MRGSISVKGFSGASLWYLSSTAAKAVRISSSVFDTPWRPNVGRNQSRIPVSKSISVPTTSNVSVSKSRSLISSPLASSHGGYGGPRILSRRPCASFAARFPRDERNVLERRHCEVPKRAMDASQTLRSSTLRSSPSVSKARNRSSIDWALRSVTQPSPAYLEGPGVGCAKRIARRIGYAARECRTVGTSLLQILARVERGRRTLGNRAASGGYRSCNRRDRLDALPADFHLLQLEGGRVDILHILRERSRNVARPVGHRPVITGVGREDRGRRGVSSGDNRHVEAAFCLVARGVGGRAVDRGGPQGEGVA